MTTAKDIVGSVLREYGYDARSAKTRKIIRRLLQRDIITHHANALDAELRQALTEPQLRLMPRAASSALGRPNVREVSRKPTSTTVIETRARVANMMAGRPFKAPIHMADLPPGTLEICNHHGVDEISGLAINMEDAAVEGQIDVAGDYQVSLFCFLVHANGDRQRVKAQLKITVVPDPRSLWKTLPSDATARFHKPDTHFEQAENSQVRLTGASVRGRSHAHRGTHRDDDFRIACAAQPQQWSVLCVADGAGSCRYSRRGSEVAVARSTRTLKEALNGHYGELLEQAWLEYERQPGDAARLQLQQAYQHTIVKAVYDAARAITEEVDETSGDRFKDFSTTLLLAAHKVTGDGQHLVLSFAVGDGAIALYHHEQSVSLLCEPDGGEYAGQTRFLDTRLFADGQVYERVKMTQVSSATALILATDGITDPWFETNKALTETAQWDRLWQQIRPVIDNHDCTQMSQQLLDWMGFWSAGHHDDRSIAICRIKEST